MEPQDSYVNPNLTVQQPTWDRGVGQKSPPVADPEVKQSNPEETRRELSDAIAGSNEILVGFSTALTIFPDRIVLDRAKLTVNKRTFMNSSQIVSIRVEDVLNITAIVGPIFGWVEISSRVVNANTYRIGKIWRNDALKFKRIAQGYILALQRNIDCNALSTEELRAMLYKLGEDEHPVIN